MKKTVSRKQTLRRRWLAAHLYLGIIFGSVFAVTGMTGSLLVFYIELDEILNPELQVVFAQTQPRLSYEAIFQALQRAEPDRQSAWRLEIPADPQRMLSARYYKPKETEHAPFAPLMVSIDPYRGEVVKRRFWGRFAMTWIYDLHYMLLFDQAGKIMMAIIGGMLLVSMASGIYLWWPSPHKWRTALSVKLGASPERITYDLHKTAGVYSLIVILILALTGIALEIPEYVNPLIDAASPLRPLPKPHSHSQAAHNNRITLDQAVAKAQRLFPDARLCWIETPQSDNGSYRINLRQSFEPSQRFPKTNVWVDQYNGEILAVNDPKYFSGGDRLISWLHPLHSGEAFALPGRLLVLVTGLLCPLLLLTGMLRWWQKRRAKRTRPH
ncbi:MAG: PepSY domain-containing protein [Methylobacter sp.]|nr:PepSY domain-containing protein [Methylobacter sp.]